MADIDSLQIKIKADANNASNALDKLANSLTNFQRSLSIDTSKLTSISNSIQSIANAASSMNTSGIKNISTLTNSINRMGKIDTSGLSRISSALKTFSADMAGTKVDGVGDIASIASSISRLGGVASGRAVTNIPLLAKNLKQLFTTLSTAPNVSENIIRMTNALAGLASTGAASGRAANSLGRNLNTYTVSARRATKSTFSLAAAFGRFYATYFLVIRGIKSLWKSIEGTTDYIEAFNYYTVAFNKVGKEWGKDFEQFGYDNAEDYAQSFGNRVNELLGKMSGLKVDVDGGLISESGMKNLGLNLQEITQYASQLASITNSLGQTGEVTTAISKSMTMLAGDISSLFNVDFSTVATNLQSGLIGQSRALYKYGIDITNATLQTYAYKYGIEKAVSEMSQAEKQQLRLLAILDQSKVSWGDLANTINSPSNMIRQFTNNVKEAGMVLGQLFIPVLQKVLPVINGVVIAIKRLLVSVANLLGIKIDFSSFGQGVSGYNEDLEDTADALDKVGTSAKNAQSGIRAFDKLKVISTPKSSGSGSGAGGAGIDLTKEIMDATAEYEKVWQEAFDKMQNTALGWADKIEKLLEPVKKLFKDLFNGDFFEAGQDLSGIVTGIFNWMSDAIASVDWYQIGQNIGQFLAGIDWTAVFTSAGNFIGQAITAAIELWKGSFDAAPIETTILTAIGLLKFTGVGDIIWGKISDKLSAKVLGSSIGIVPTIAIAAVTWEIGFNVGKSLGKALFPEDAEYYDNFTWFGENGFFDTLKNTDFATLKTAWDDLYKDITDNDLYRFLTGTMLLPKHSTLDDFGDKIDWLIDKIKNTKVDMSDTFGLSSALINIAPLVGNWFNENVSPWFTKEKWQGMGQTIESSLSEKWTSFTTWWNQTGFSNWWKKISEQFGPTKWNKLLENIPTAFRTAFKTAANVAIAPLNLVISGIETMINNAIDLINGLMSAARLIPKIGDAVPNNIQHISVGRIPTFEKGGYVPSRYTMFMAGENGVPEMLGTVGGKTAVAGGEEITRIRDAVISTAQQEIALLRQNNQLLQGILEKEFGITTDQIGIAARQYGQEQFNQKHKNVYVF
jgi:hypothetical protein